MLALIPFLFACDMPESTPRPETPSTTPAEQQGAPDSPPEPPEATATPEEAPSPTLTNTTGGSAGTLPNLAEGLQRGLCSNGPGNEGADSYFVGSFSIENGQIRGSETWMLFSNPQWQARGGSDCSITWNVTGTETPGGGSCGACDSTISFQAVADIHGSQCPEELVLGRLLPNGQRAGGEATDFNQSYAIERRADGTAKIYFSRSGRLLGEGYHNGGGLTYVSSHSCKWF